MENLKVLNGLLGRKIGMTQIFDEHGEIVPVTVLEVGPGYVIQKKNKDKEGYDAVQLGFLFSKSDNKIKLNNPTKGKLKKAGLESRVLNYFREYHVLEGQDCSIGEKITCQIFKEGEKVDVSGYIKGRGFTGGMKRHNWHGQPKTHGSMMHRRPGGISASADPSRVFKGKELPGQYGATRVTVQRLTIRKVDPEENIILIQGAIPGYSQGIIEIRKTTKIKGINKKK